MKSLKRAAAGVIAAVFCFSSAGCGDIDVDGILEKIPFFAEDKEKYELVSDDENTVRRVRFGRDDSDADTDSDSDSDSKQSGFYERKMSGIKVRYDLDLALEASGSEAAGTYTGGYTLDLKGDLGKIGSLLDQLSNGLLESLMTGHAVKEQAELRFEPYDEAAFKDFEKEANAQFDAFRSDMPSEEEREEKADKLAGLLGKLVNSEKPKVNMSKYKPVLMFTDPDIDFDEGKESSTLMMNFGSAAGFTAFADDLITKIGGMVGAEEFSEEIPQHNIPWSILLMDEGTAVCTIYTIDPEHPLRFLGSWGAE